VHPVRRWNVRDWGEYRARLARGEPPEESRERLDAEAGALERVWLALRTAEGLPTAGLGAEALGLARGWEEHGLAEIRSGRLRLSAPGWLRLDGLAVELHRANAHAAPPDAGAPSAPAG
jgi:coproporphyrinogen III oxidase-like Fe-S oxidoreductase